LRNLANALEDRDERSATEARLIVDTILDDYRASTGRPVRSTASTRFAPLMRT